MWTRTYFLALVTLLLAGDVLPLQAQASHRRAEPQCLSAESIEAQLLTLTVRRTAVHEGRGYRVVRERAFGGAALDTASIAVVTDPAVCAKAHRLIDASLVRPGYARSGAIAVARIAHRYVARYSHFAPAIDHEVTRTYFFDSEFAKILAVMAS